MVAAIGFDLAERHRFDQREVAAGGAIVEHRQQLIFIQPRQRDHVDLDRQPCGARRGDPAERGIDIADAGRYGEGGGIERVEADVDAAHTAAASIVACSASRIPLVVSVSSSRPCPTIAPSRFASMSMPRRTSGSPPVRRMANPARDEPCGEFAHFLDASTADLGRMSYPRPCNSGSEDRSGR